MATTDVIDSLIPTAEERRDAIRALAHPDRLRAVFGHVLMTGDARERAATVCTLVGRLLRADHAAVNLLTDDEQVTVAVAHGDLLPPPIDVQASVCQFVVQAGKPFVVVDAQANHLLTSLEMMTAQNMRCYLGAPLVHEGHVLGALCVYGNSERQWTLDEVTLLQAWADVLMHLPADDEQVGDELELQLRGLPE